MSCHDIGRGMDSVTKVVIAMFDNEELTRDAALKLFTALKNGVHWCDGNENEAVASIIHCRCGKCLKEMKSGEKLFNIYDCSPLVGGNPWDILDNYNGDYGGWYFCKNCFDEIIKEVTDGKISGEAARNFIEESNEDL